MAKLPAFAVLLLLPVAFAGQAQVNQFISASFEPGQNVTVQALSNPTFAIISSNGVETYLVNVQTGVPINDSASIISILQADVKANSGFDAKTAAAASLPQDVSAAKQSDEAQCMLLTGTDTHECTSLDTCKVACLSNPNCASSVYFANGFIEALLDWTTSRVKFGSDLASYPQNISAVSSDSAVLSQKVTVLSDMSFLAANMSDNPIFLNSSDPGCTDGSRPCFEYCPKINYSQARIDAEKSDLQSISATVASLQAQSARAGAILAAGQANDAYLSARGSSWEAFRLEMEDSLSALGKRAASLDANVTDPEVASGLAALNNSSLAIGAQADAGYYKAALAQKASFESQSSALSARMDADAAAFASFSTGVDALSAKVDSSEGIIGSDSAQSYRLRISQIRSSLSTNATLGQLGLAANLTGSLSQNLTDEIAADFLAQQSSARAPPLQILANQTAQQNRSAQPSSPLGLPCMPGLALVLLVGAAFRHRS